MQTVTDSLSKDDIKNLAEHYSALSFKPMKQKFNAALVEKGKKKHKKVCEKCHSDGATNADDASILAGQGRRYLEAQFDLIANNERRVPKKMIRRFSKLTDNEKRALLEYYISQY